jgi:hypothetical protein
MKKNGDSKMSDIWIDNCYLITINLKFISQNHPKTVKQNPPKKIQKKNNYLLKK